MASKAERDRFRREDYGEAAEIVRGCGSVAAAVQRLLERSRPPETPVDMAEQRRLGEERRSVRSQLREAGQYLQQDRARSHAVGHRDTDLYAAMCDRGQWLGQVAGRALRLGLTRRQIADAAGVTRPTLQKWIVRSAVSAESTPEPNHKTGPS
jgi:hypothetical protein